MRFTSNIWIGDADKDADVEIRYGKGIWPGYTSNQLTWDELFPVCSPELVGGEVSPEDPPSVTLMACIVKGPEEWEL